MPCNGSKQQGRISSYFRPVPNAQPQTEAGLSGGPRAESPPQHSPEPDTAQGPPAATAAPADGSAGPLEGQQPADAQDFEQERLQRIQRNLAHMQQLGLVGAVSALPPAKPAVPRKRKQEAAVPRERRVGLRSQQVSAAAVRTSDDQVISGRTLEGHLWGCKPLKMLGTSQLSYKALSSAG